MRRITLSAVTVLAAAGTQAAWAATAAPQVTYIHAGKLLDRPGQARAGPPRSSSAMARLPKCATVLSRQKMGQRWWS